MVSVMINIILGSLNAVGMILNNLLDPRKQLGLLRVRVRHRDYVLGVMGSCEVIF